MFPSLCLASLKYMVEPLYLWYEFCTFISKLFSLGWKEIISWHIQPFYIKKLSKRSYTLRTNSSFRITFILATATNFAQIWFVFRSHWLIEPTTSNKPIFKLAWRKNLKNNVNKILMNYSIDYVVPTQDQNKDMGVVKICIKSSNLS